MTPLPARTSFLGVFGLAGAQSGCPGPVILKGKRTSRQQYHGGKCALRQSIKLQEDLVAPACQCHLPDTTASLLAQLRHGRGKFGGKHFGMCSGEG